MVLVLCGLVKILTYLCKCLKQSYKMILMQSGTLSYPRRRYYIFSDQIWIRSADITGTIDAVFYSFGYLFSGKNLI